MYTINVYMYFIKNYNISYFAFFMIFIMRILIMMDEIVISFCRSLPYINLLRRSRKRCNCGTILKQPKMSMTSLQDTAKARSEHCHSVTNLYQMKRIV